jgi:hypothetical protein
MTELALRPASSASARMPPSARKRCEAGSGSHWCDCGAGALSVSVVDRLALAWLIVPNRPLSLTLFLPCDLAVHFAPLMGADVAGGPANDACEGLCASPSGLAGRHRPAPGEGGLVGKGGQNGDEALVASRFLSGHAARPDRLTTRAGDERRGRQAIRARSGQVVTPLDGPGAANGPVPGPESAAR